MKGLRLSEIWLNIAIVVTAKEDVVVDVVHDVHTAHRLDFSRQDCAAIISFSYVGCGLSFPREGF